MDSDVESHGTHDEPLTILSLCDHLQGLLMENGMVDLPVSIGGYDGDGYFRTDPLEPRDVRIVDKMNALRGVVIG